MADAPTGGRISSTANPAVKSARRLARRPPTGSRELLVEGPQAVREAIPFLRRLFVSDLAARQHEELLAAVRSAGVQILACTEGVVATIAGTVNPQGIVGVAQLPAVSLDVVTASARFLIALVDIRDPGNLGTIIRSADAAGADAVVLVGDCVDPRNPKAVRSSTGSLFHLPVVAAGAFANLADRCARHGITMVGTAADGSLPYTEMDLTGPTALVFGNEAHGLDATVTAACDKVTRIPIASGGRPGWSGAAESLNLAAAAAVVAFEVARQRRTGPQEPAGEKTAGER